jgi:Uma2 family endonuclease
MNAQAAPRSWSYEEFAQLPDDGNRHEIIAGDVYMTPAPRPIHQRVATRLASVLDPFAIKHRLGVAFVGPIDVLFGESDYLQPDLVFVRTDRMGIVTDRGIEGAPDLVVEIVSRSTADRDRGVKRGRYARFGVFQYWVVDVERKQVEVYRMTRDPDLPDIVRDTLVWQLAPEGPALEIQVSELLKDLER